MQRLEEAEQQAEASVDVPYPPLQGEVTPIDSVLTPATAVKKFDLEFWALTA